MSNRVRIEPQPEKIKNTDDAWLYDGEAYMPDEQMESHLFHDVYSGEKGNSTVFYECYPVLVDGVWYWQDDDQQTEDFNAFMQEATR